MSVIEFDTEKYTSIEVSNDLLELTEEEGFTYLHCTYYTSPKYIGGWWVNIWKTSYLTSNASTDRLQLLQAIGVPHPPDKLYLKRKGDFVRFTLIFPAVPTNWKVFNFIEVCGSDHDNGLSISNITRNSTGVYKVRIQ